MRDIIVIRSNKLIEITWTCNLVDLYEDSELDFYHLDIIFVCLMFLRSYLPLLLLSFSSVMKITLIN